MDLFPTLAGLCGAEIPTDRTIDGRDISALLLDDAAPSPHEVFLYYWMDDLEAVRVGRWKLHLAKHGTAFTRLHDLDADPAEEVDVHDEHPDVVAELLAHAEAARADLGDALTGVEGADRRPVGTVDDPRTLTVFDEDYPYYAAEYDLPDRG
jgi:arylsulfatase A-like enzyme